MHSYKNVELFLKGLWNLQETSQPIGGKVPEILPQQAHKWRNETWWDEGNLLEPKIRREALEDADQDDEYIVIKTTI